MFICGVAMKLSSASLGNMLMYPFKNVLESYSRSVIRVYMFFSFIYLSMRFLLSLFNGYPIFFS